MKKFIAILFAIIFCVGCMNSVSHTETDISQPTVPKYKHRDFCRCDSFLGYKECDTINFGGCKFFGLGNSEEHFVTRPNFYFQRTPKTHTPYQVVLSSKGAFTREIINACEKNVPNFRKINKSGSLGHYYYALDKRLLSLLPDMLYECHLGKKNGKEYFLAYKKRLRDGKYYFEDSNLYITDLACLKQYEKEQYELDAPIREAVKKAKEEKERNAEIFPF